MPYCLNIIIVFILMVVRQTVSCLSFLMHSIGGGGLLITAIMALIGSRLYCMGYKRAPQRIVYVCVLKGLCW